MKLKAITKYWNQFVEITLESCNISEFVYFAKDKREQLEGGKEKDNVREEGTNERQE